MKEKTTLLFLSNQRALQDAILQFHPDETYFKPFMVVPEVKGVWGHLGATSNLVLFYATSQFNLPERLLHTVFNEIYSVPIIPTGSP